MLLSLRLATAHNKEMEHMKNLIEQAHRRDFLTAAVGTLAAVTIPTRLHATELTSGEQEDTKVVTDMCAAWTAPMDMARLAPFLSDDCVFRASATAEPVTGHDAIFAFLQRIVGEATFCEFEVVETFARGPIVVTDRWDRFVLPTRKIDWHGVGVFYMKDGKIAEWSDYTVA